MAGGPSLAWQSTGRQRARERTSSDAVSPRYSSRPFSPSLRAPPPPDHLRALEAHKRESRSTRPCRWPPALRDFHDHLVARAPGSCSRGLRRPWNRVGLSLRDCPDNGSALMLSSVGAGFICVSYMYLSARYCALDLVARGSHRAETFMRSEIVRWWCAPRAARA